MNPYIIDDIPGDKSISHRAIMIASLATGTTTFKGFLTSDDCLNTLNIFRQMGVQIDQDNTTITVHGVGKNGLKSPSDTLDVGNSGTAIRLISGLLCGTSVNASMTGDASIQQRPMDRILQPLTQMGANITAINGYPPLTIIGNPKHIHPIEYRLPVASAQVKSAILLAGVSANVPVSVIEPEPCRDHTERMLRLFGLDVKYDKGRITLKPHPLQAPKTPVQIPADISSALFFICNALMTNQSVIFKNIGLNESRIGCLTVLKEMGANIQITPKETGFEPMGDIHVMPSNQMKNICVPVDLIPNVIDELPILATLASTLPGEFKVRNASELRVKESDRIEGIVRLMNAIKIPVESVADGFTIQGQPGRVINDFEYDANDDHRLAMSAFIVAGAHQVTAQVTGTHSISTSFPNFRHILQKIRLGK